MISKKYIKELELGGDTENDFFDYIIRSEEVGQYGQVRELVAKLSRTQYNGFLLYLQDSDIKLRGCYLK